MSIPFFVMIPILYTIGGYRITTPFDSKYVIKFNQILRKI